MKLIQNIKGKFFSSKKKTITTVAVLAVLVIGGIYIKGKVTKPVDMPLQIRTTVVKKGSITDVVTGSGAVKSKSIVNVTTPLTYKVKEILVQVGDTVKKGDIIAKLDTTDIAKSINEEKTRLNDLKKTAQENYDKSITEKNRAYDKAIASENEYKTAKNNYDTANNLFNQAKNSVANFQKEYDTAAKTMQEKGLAMNDLTTKKSNADTKVIDLNNKVAAAQQAYDNATATDKPVKEEALRLAKEELKTAESEQSKLATDLLAAQTDYNTAKSNFETKETQLKDAKAACNYATLETNFNAASTALDGVRSTLDINEKSYESAISAEKSAKKTLDDASTSEVLKDLNEKLSQCVIKSESNGVITNINGVVGSSIATGILAVIQDTDNLVVSTSFKEYDVSNVKIGQKVIITSDATGDKEIIGHVSQLSLTSASATDTSFPAEITIDDKDTGLLIGMTAKVKVILNEKNDIFVVPFDAVGTDAQGDKVVYRQEADGSFAPIKVTTGQSNDYEIEINSPDIKEGTVIRSSADEGAAGMMGGTTGGDTQMSTGGMSVTMG